MMKKLFSIFTFFSVITFFAQTDYSSSWEDFYSYNNVKDFVKVDQTIYALVDNAVFTYNITTLETQKLSSVQGLSGETTTAIYYSKTYQRLIIGYENGLVEVVESDGTITISSDIVNFNQSGEKSINDISEFSNKLYLATPFGIVVYNIENLEFGDTYFIGNNSSSLQVNQTSVVNNIIYAATENGIFTADVTSNLLIDFNNWTQLALTSTKNYAQIAVFNTEVFTVENRKLYRINGVNLIEEKNYNEPILAIKASASHLTITLQETAKVLDNLLQETFQFTNTPTYNFTLENAFFEENIIYLATNKFGLLTTSASAPTAYLEVHPEGPMFNDVFSVTAKNNHLWVVYGGYNGAYTPQGVRKGFSHFNGENWINTKHTSTLPADLVHVAIDPNNEEKVFISALGVSSNLATTPTGGLLVIEEDIVTQQYNHLNSSFSPILVSLPSINIRVSTSVFDRQGNLWATNYETDEELVKLAANGQWSSVSLKSVQTSAVPGLSEMAVDNRNSIWIGSRRNGVYIYNENGNRKKALVTAQNEGSLPDLNVRTIAIDKRGSAWLGTRAGLAVYNNASGVFEDENPVATPIIINVDENGFGDRLLGDQTINSIVIDGADNKWIGTENGGVLYTNPNGQETLANFSTQNSPLPSNSIIKIAVDTATGKVFFATSKGIVAYNSNVAPFGDVLAEVYAYPNPALKNHETITITGRNGTFLPKGTNVKILDVAGYLVHETNVVEGEELQGGKVVWNKKNLAGNQVASGVYIVLLASPDASETSVVKVAIVN